VITVLQNQNQPNLSVSEDTYVLFLKNVFVTLHGQHHGISRGKQTQSYKVKSFFSAPLFKYKNLLCWQQSWMQKQRKVLLIESRCALDEKMGIFLWEFT